jgi:hypothetical protein
MTKKSQLIWAKNVSGMGSSRIMLRADDTGIFAKQLGAAAVRAKSKASLPTAAVPCVIVEVRPDSKGRDRLSFGLDHTIKGD